MRPLPAGVNAMSLIERDLVQICGDLAQSFTGGTSECPVVITEVLSKERLGFERMSPEFAERLRYEDFVQG